MARTRFGKKAVENTGLNTATTEKYARFVNKNGQPNITMTFSSLSEGRNIYNYLINIPVWRFLLLVILYYTLINFAFAIIYYLFCVPKLAGLIQGTGFETFEETFFFSAQTLTTVGYGRISPIGLFTNIVASLEALIGILTLALVTGLLYGRFVRPKAFVRFSHHALIAPYKDGKSLMFRLTPIKNATLSEVQIHVSCSMMENVDGNKISKYYELPLQMNLIHTLFISWTVVHPINEDSPLYGLSFKDLEELDFEMLVYFKAFDEGFSNTVMCRTSYTYDEIINGAKFVPVYYDSPDGKGTFVDLNKLNKYEHRADAMI